MLLERIDFGYPGFLRTASLDTIWFVRRIERNADQSCSEFRSWDGSGRVGGSRFRNPINPKPLLFIDS